MERRMGMDRHHESAEYPSPMTAPVLLVFGLGYSAAAIARDARDSGWTVIGTQRRPGPAPSGVETVPFDAAESAIARATHVLSSVPPGTDDPVLSRYSAALRGAPGLVWIGYLSTTGVYGNRDGGWVDESTPPAPGSERGRRRVAAEAAWSEFADRVQVDLFRLAGIYGPGRSVLDDVRAGTARAVVKPGQEFGRIHRDDIVRAVRAAMDQAKTAGRNPRVLNLTDDMPAASAEVIAEAARLLGLPAPEPIPFETARATMSPMALSFWADNRRVAAAATQAALGLRWRYPTFRDGLRAILVAEQGGDRADEQRQVPLA